MSEPIGVIFDFDGVIADTEPTHERAMLEVAERHGMTFTHDRFLTEYIGFADDDAFRLVCRDNGERDDPERISGLVREKNDAFLRLISEGGVSAFPGTLRLAEHAADLGPVLICSGAVRVEIEAVLSAVGAGELFESIVSADDVERAKPAPAGYLLACGRAGLPPSRCVAIEDTPKGITAAISAGMSVVGVEHSLPASELGRADLVRAGASEVGVEDLRTLVRTRDAGSPPRRPAPGTP